MYLIIAEKPSLAKNILAGIAKVQSDEMKKHNGYYEGGSYIVSWVFGHLFSLADIEDYSPTESTKWTMDNLPCFPEEFKFNLKKGADKKVDAGVKKQFETIKYLCNRRDVDTIVNAGDADREGEIIVRICVSHATDITKKKFVRLWLPDQTPQTIQSALSDMKNESEYDALANEGFARTYIDWLYGVNLTRYATLKTGKLLRVGRVIVPIVKAIYDRDHEIRDFKVEKYYVISSHEMTNDEYVDLTSKEKRFTKDEYEKALEECEKYNAEKAIVTSVKKKKTTISPPKLFSLSKLQSYLGKKYKLSMDDTLTTVQKLYEEGYVTYPRTNSEYLATAEQGKVKSILQNVAKLGYPVSFKFSKSIFDDSKIESHSALTPTYKIPDPKTLSDREKTVYTAIFKRFVAVFCAQDCIAEKSEIKIKVGELEEFTLSGTVIIDKGWTAWDDYNQKDKILPKLEKDDEVNIRFVPVEKETTPPKHYTIETLNNYLKNPFKEDKANADESDDEEYRAIFEGLELGTEATRTGIIENACKSAYISLKKDSYYILPDGEYLIDSLSQLGISMDKYKTSELGQALKKVYRGEFAIQDSVSLAQTEINNVFSLSKELTMAPEKDTNIGFYGDFVGLCPLCGGNVIRTKFGYGCSNFRENGCKFSVSKSICSRTISVSNVKMLLATGKTSKIQGFISKTGKAFDASLKLENGRVVFDFPNPMPQKQPQGGEKSQNAAKKRKNN